MTIQDSSFQTFTEWNGNLVILRLTYLEETMNFQAFCLLKVTTSSTGPLLSKATLVGLKQLEA